MVATRRRHGRRRRHLVGVIDTGVWPESRSFAGGTGIPVPADWRGTCVDGEQFTKHMCNDKLIGARYYLEGFGRKFVARDDYLSPRDGDGHGSHTASTAAGNKVTDVAIDGVQFEDGIASGMAPGAKVAAYKVCWEGAKEIPAGCFNSDSVAAINDAVLDGVDVLNYSIGGTSESSALTRSTRHFGLHRTPASTSPTRPGTTVPVSARSTTPRHG